jgi:tetratricopeptide (TPR) repeat protein
MDDPDLTDSNRLRVYQLANESAVSRLAGTGASGFYEARVSGAVAFVPRIAGSRYTEWDLDTEQIFFHEYAHHLQLQYASIPLPPWLIEGFAEFFATASIEKDGGVLIGLYPKYRAGSLFDNHGLSLEQMVGATYGKLDPYQLDALYGQGWLLMHYLSFDQSRRGQLSKYVDAIQNGMTPLDSAKTAFGDLKVLRRDLDHYAKGRISALRIDGRALSTGSVKIRQLGPGETAIMPVHIRSTRGVTQKTAPGVAADARKAAAPYPNDPFVQAVLAEAEYDVGNFEASEAAADRALKADANNVHALIRKGMADMAIAAKNPGSTNWDQIRSWFIKANKIDTENAEPLALFYYSFLIAREKPTKNAVDALLYAVNLAPQDVGARLAAVNELLVEDRAKDAKAMLAPLAYRPHTSAEFREAMTDLMVAISAGDTKAALNLMQKAAQKDPDQTPN